MNKCINERKGKQISEEIFQKKLQKFIKYLLSLIFPIQAEVTKLDSGKVSQAGGLQSTSTSTLSKERQGDCH
jgi:hypothetical protein